MFIYNKIRNMASIEREWKAAWANGTRQRLVPLHLLTGSVLPLLPTIQKVAEQFRLTQSYNRAARLKVGVACVGLHTQDMVELGGVGAVSGQFGRYRPCRHSPSHACGEQQLLPCPRPC